MPALLYSLAMTDGVGRGVDVDSFSDGTEIEPWPQAHPGPNAPVSSYPDPPRVALSRFGYSLEGRYTVPLAGQELTDAVRSAIFNTGRLALVDLDENAAHIANRATVGVGTEAIILRFVPVSPTETRIDGVDRSPVGTINTRPGNLPALLQDIERQIRERNADT